MASEPVVPATDVHPAVRRALGVALSAKEYKRLHDLAARYTSAGALAKLPSPSRYESVVHSKHKDNEAAIRVALRTFVGAGAALKLAEIIISRIKKGTAQ